MDRVCVVVVVVLFCLGLIVVCIGLVWYASVLVGLLMCVLSLGGLDWMYWLYWLVRLLQLVVFVVVLYGGFGSGW